MALLIIMGASTLSALSGVGKGIKWLSNINMGLSFFVLAFFLVFGATLFGLQALFVGVWDYLVSLPRMLFTVWTKDATPTGDALAGWQGSWTIFYWAWWIAFAPFVGLFLARISRGRTVREYVLGAMIVPSIMCFVWFAFVGGTAIDLELTGQAQGAIVAAGQDSQLFAMLGVMLRPDLAWAMSIVVVVLLLTYLVTSADSAVLIINTINAAGDEGPKARPHILFWGVALALVVGGLIVAGGLGAIKTAMVIGALPFSLVMVLMGIALIKGIWLDSLREKRGMRTTRLGHEPRVLGTSSRSRVSRASAAPWALQRRDLDLDSHPRIGQPGGDHRRGRTHVAEIFAAVPASIARPRPLRHHVVHAHHVRQVDPAWPKAASMFRRHCSVCSATSVGDRHRRVVEAGGAGDEDPVAVHDGARIADLGLEGRAGADESSGHLDSLFPIGVTMLSPGTVAPLIPGVRPAGSRPRLKRALPSPPTA